MSLSASRPISLIIGGSGQDGAYLARFLLDKGYSVWISSRIGENNSYLNSMRKKQNLNLNFVLKDEDKFSWQFSNKGYFNFKNNIPKILSKLNV